MSRSPEESCPDRGPTSHKRGHRVKIDLCWLENESSKKMRDNGYIPDSMLVDGDDVCENQTCSARSAQIEVICTCK